MNNVEENKLINRRKSCKGTLTRLHKFVTDFNKEINDIQEIITRQTMLDNVHHKFDEIQSELESIDYEKHASAREEFENKFLFTKSNINKHMKLNEKESASSSSITTPIENTNFVPQIKLPDVHLPSFSGDYKEWQNFKDLFIGLVHDNNQILPVQKLYYLKGALQGEACKTIQAITPSADNYAIAWQLLTERYDNKQLNVNCHLKALFEQPHVARDSVTGLRKLLTDTKQHRQCLEVLEIPVKHWDVMLIYLLSNKLDSLTRRDWELSKKDDKLPTLDNFYKFLEKRCIALEFVNQDKIRLTNKSVHAATAATNNIKTKSCKLCNEEYHHLYNCNSFLKSNLQNRLKAIKLTGACYNCLRYGHSSFQCNSKGCRACNKKHNTLIHQSKNKTEDSTESIKTEDSVPLATAKGETSRQSDTVSLHNANNINQILLSTARISTQDQTGNWQLYRAILDSASQINLIRRKAVNQLRLRTIPINTTINGISTTRTTANEAVRITIKSTKNNFLKSVEFIIVDDITCDLPSLPFDISKWKIPQNIDIADPEFNEPGSIDMLLGGEIFYDVLEYGHFKLGKHLPVLQNTKLGWIVGGKIGTGPINKDTATHTCAVTSQSSLENILTRFWEIETIQERKQTFEERKCEEHFKQNVTRNNKGRYIVKLPLKTTETSLGNSYQEARRRFLSLEKRFLRDPELKAQYCDFIKEYILLNHMEIAPADPEYTACYLPHHPVFKYSNNEKKIRVVFDASMKTSSGNSLNDILMVGPVVQQELMEIVLRFRTHLVVFTADIEKMYRQILVTDDQFDLQRIIWRNTETDELQSYHLKTVTYGTATAPYLATRVLNQLAIDEARKHPAAAARVAKDFYVDDIMTGTNSIETCLILQNQIINLLKEGQFKLRKWCSNKTELLRVIDPKDCEMQLPLSIGGNEVKTLGLLWLPAEDTFKIVINTNNKDLSNTKRKILGDIASIFDPLGLLGPVITVAKLIMQNLWKIKANWDEPIEGEILCMWKQWREQLDDMKKVQIERCLFNHNLIKNIEIHGFCDASQTAYGAAIYVLTEYENGSKSSKLLCSKSRTAPLKQTTIPRLELCGALILAKLISKVTNCIEIQTSKIYLWTDSTIVLAWLRTPSTKWNTFVANRTSEIQELTSECHWGHVPSEDNPADFISRGIQLSGLLNSKLWWEGPCWLMQTKTHWPNTLADENISEQIPEEKTKTNIVLITIDRWDIFNRFSTLNKLQRVIAYCLRFVNNMKFKREKRDKGPLNTSELQKSLKSLIRRAQEETYFPDIKEIQSKKVIRKQSHLTSLNCFLDESQLLRVGGRIQKAIVSYEQRHPIILPKSHTLTKLIIINEHKRLLHGGVQAVLTSIRRNYWPVNGRNTTRQLINQCITCYRFKAKPAEQIMGNLPSYRIQPSRPFLKTGIDYGGPIYIKQGLRKNSSLRKAYFALFICLCTRAVHIELVNDLSTKSFLYALKRFMARRGKCKEIYSDNATNFKGASHELNDIYQLFKTNETRIHILDAAANEGITWYFIPPRAPHFGGLWEAGIKSVKYHLKRVVGNANLNYEEMYTALTLIEACLNSRPLIPLTHDPDDFSILTPAHFLIGDLLTNVPDQDVTYQQGNRLAKWQHVQRIQQHFWKRWSNEYLAHLQRRSKWQKKKSNLQEGMVVLIKEENLPPLNWPIARISKTHCGDDGHVRVVTIKVPGGREFKRPVTKICPLPVDNQE